VQELQEHLSATDGVLGMALRALGQVYEHIDTCTIREAWPTATEEVAHG
jgi:hypothetical protein